MKEIRFIVYENKLTIDTLIGNEVQAQLDRNVMITAKLDPNDS